MQETVKFLDVTVQHKTVVHVICNFISNSNFIIRLSPAFLIEFQNVFATLIGRINTPQFRTQNDCTNRYEAVMKFNLHIKDVSITLNELIGKPDYLKNAE